MPYVDIISSSGPLQIYYNVARPDNPNADKIDANLPTVIFIHALYVGQQVFEGMSARSIHVNHSCVVLNLSQLNSAIAGSDGST